eukprot:Hpha_TRINITY_DN27124_c0_g1::TRINITY_DN27124_c0_g1_i1::g.29347::m.29347
MVAEGYCGQLRAEFCRSRMALLPPAPNPCWVVNLGQGAFHRDRRVEFVAVRVVLAVLMAASWGIVAGWSAMRGKLGTIFVFLTIWTLTLELFYFILSAVVAIQVWQGGYTPCGDDDSTRICPLSLARPVALLRAVVVPAAMIVSLAYWTLLAPSRFAVHDFCAHGMNLILILADLALSGYSYPFAHIVYMWVYGVVYVSWSAIHYACTFGNGINDERYIYPFLDWSEKKVGPTLAMVIALALILAPLCVLWAWSIVYLRKWYFAEPHQTPTESVVGTTVDVVGSRYTSPQTHPL